MTRDEKAIVWLSACTGLEYRDKIALLRAAEKPSYLFDRFEKISKSVLKSGINGLYNIGGNQREAQADAFLARLEEKGRFAVTLESEDFPVKLMNAVCPPLVLYGEGNRSLLSKERFCIVGSRITPAWAETAGKKIAQELTPYFVIVTGLAEGGDCAAISGALPSGNLICVLPSGLDDCYPAAHASLKKKVGERGLLLSEFPFHEPLRRGSFHARNRILAALSKGVLVISAGHRSGALITANRALDCGTDLFAFPYNVGVMQGAGCNELLKKGAYVTTGAEDIFFQFGITPKKKRSVELSEQEARILEIVSEEGELHAAVIARRAGIQIYEAAAALSALEMKGLVVKSGGNRYSAI